MTQCSFSSSSPFFAQRNEPQLDPLIRTLFHFYRCAACFLGFQKVSIAPRVIFQILPGIERVAPRSQTANGKATTLIGGSDAEAIGKLAVFFLGNGYDGGA